MPPKMKRSKKLIGSGVFEISKLKLDSIKTQITNFINSESAKK